MSDEMPVNCDIFSNSVIPKFFYIKILYLIHYNVQISKY